ncbi:helix-turn-helix domain-containing protein [Curtobacterium sp. A7_M15]|uniref:XRE family transcriptional regulator n=1 Tax=Curtobacterium sp. A7_M15 TaxID=3065241 RepID=UPI0027379A0D|nr:XRE family transcriptional regulator [Curtobacterium sp. A7_M15]MDP4332659.1 helix-turn-helix domain-containing protein [Curtobacterium sp. A7_M15]
MQEPPHGELLRRLRTTAGRTLAELAAAAHVGVRTLSDIERGVARRPQRATIEAIASALGATAAERAALLSIGRADPATPESAPDVVVDFTGRGRELSKVLDHLRDDRPGIVLVSGGPGIGKSTFAAEALRVHGVPWVHVDLAGQTTSPLSALDVLRRLVTRATDGAEEAPAVLDAAAARWRGISADHPHAVLLDDAASEAQVRPVVEAAAPGTPVIVTSRSPLAGLDAGLRVQVDPLHPVDAHSLLERIVPDAADDPALATVADQCAGIPLALRIAGSRIAAGVDDVHGFLGAMRAEERRLGALRHGDRSVESAFAVSYERLPVATARLFRSLAVIDGTSFDARTGGAALGLDDVTAEDALEDLVDLGLVEPRGGNRYHVHDLLRAFGADRIVAEDGPGTPRALRERLHGTVLGVLGRAARLFASESVRGGRAEPEFGDPTAARRWITAEVDHWWAAFRAAVSDGRHGEVARIATGLEWFSNLWPAWGHWYELFGDAVDAAHTVGDRASAARLLGLQTWAALMERGDRAGALELATRGLADAREADDDAVSASAEYHVAWAYLALRQPERALPHIDAAIDGNTRTGDDAALVQCRSMAGAALHLLGRHDEAIAAFRAVLRDLDRVGGGDPGAVFTRVVALEEIAKSANALGRWDEAREAADEGFDAASEMSWDTGAARALRQRAEALLGSGETERARRDAERGMALVDADRADAQAGAVLGELRELLDRADGGTPGVESVRSGDRLAAPPAD